MRLRLPIPALLPLLLLPGDGFGQVPTEALNPPDGPLRFHADLESALDEAKAEDKPVLLYLTSPGCVHCRRLKASVFVQEAVQEAMRPFVLAELSVVNNRLVFDRYQVRGFPTLLVLSSNGRERDRLTGFRQGPDLVRWLKQALQGRAGGAEAEWMKRLEAGTPTTNDWPDILRATGDPDLRAHLRKQVLGLSPRPVAPLVAALSHDDLAVRLAASEVLEEWSGQSHDYDPWRPVTDPGNQDALERWAAWAGATNAPTTAAGRPLDRVDEYLRDLAGDDPQAQRRATRMLLGGGPAVIPHIDTTLTEHPDWPERARRRLLGVKIALFLADAPSWDGPATAHRLLHANLDIRLEIMRNLGGLRGTGAKVLSVLRDHPEAIIRETALEGMLRSDESSALPLVEAALDTEPNPDVRIAVLRQLGKSKQRRAFALVARHLDHDEEEVRLAAIQALNATESAAYLAPRAAALLTNASWRVRAQILEAIAEQEFPVPAAALEAALDDPDPFVSRRALAALVEVHPEQAKPKVRALFMTDDTLKPALLGPLIQLDPSLLADDKLLTHLRGRPRATQLAVLQQLPSIGTAGNPLAIQYAEHDDPDFALASLAFLATQITRGDSGARGPIIQALSNQPPKAVAAILREIEQLRESRSYRDVPLNRQFDLDALRIPLPTNLPSKETVSPERLIELFTAAAPATDDAPTRPPGMAELENAVARWLDGPADARVESARLLAANGHTQAVDILSETLPSLPEREQARILQTALQDPSPASSPLVRYALFHPSQELVALATMHLMDAKASAWSNLWTEALSDPDRPLNPLLAQYGWFNSLRENQGLRRTVRDWAQAELARPEGQIQRALLALYGAGSRANMPAVQPFLDADSVWTRALAIQVLGNHDPASLAPRLPTLLGDSSLEVQRATLFSLGTGDAFQRGRICLAEDDCLTFYRQSSDARPLPLDNDVLEQIRDLQRDSADSEISLLAAFNLWLRGQDADLATVRRAVRNSSHPAETQDRLAGFAESAANKLPDSFEPLLPDLGLESEPDYATRNLRRRFASLRQTATATASPPLPSETESSSGSSPLIMLFYREHCDDCAEVKGWLEVLRSVMPYEVEQFEVDSAASRRLQAGLNRQLAIDIAPGTAPAVYAGSGGLAGEELTQDRLMELATRSLGVPRREWDPRLEPQEDTNAVPTNAVAAAPAATEPGAPALQPPPALPAVSIPQTDTPRAETRPDHASNSVAFPRLLSVNTLLLAALGLIPLWLSLRPRTWRRLVWQSGLYAAAVAAAILVVPRLGLRPSTTVAGDLLLTLGLLLPALICLFRALARDHGPSNRSRQWPLSLLLGLTIGTGLVALGQMDAVRPFSPWLAACVVLALALAAWIGGGRSTSRAPRWPHLIGCAAYATAFLTFLNRGLW